MTRARRRSDGRRRAWRGPSPARAAALLGLITAVLAGYGLATAQAFAIHRVDVSPLRWTDESELVRWLGVDEGVNAFRLSTTGLGQRLVALPAVLGASVSVALPDTLVVSVTERTPILLWHVRDATFLVDRDGMLFAEAPSGDQAAVGLPTVVDGRSLSQVILGVGIRLNSVDLDAATRLASLTPADVGSAASALAIRITDADGFVVTTSPASWSAVFGSYGRALRPPDLIPGQVRLLRSLLSGRETRVARIVLADDHNGTYLPLPSGG